MFKEVELLESIIRQKSTVNGFCVVNIRHNNDQLFTVSLDTSQVSILESSTWFIRLLMLASVMYSVSEFLAWNHL